MEIMQIYATLDGETCYYSFEDKRVANEAFLDLKEEAGLLATNNNGNVRFWIGCEQDWFVPMVEDEVSVADWNDKDNFEIRVLSQWRKIAKVKSVDPSSDDYENEWVVSFHGYTYYLTKEFCKEDEQMASLHGSRDKYYKYTFWDLGGNEMSSYCTET